MKIYDNKFTEEFLVKEYLRFIWLNFYNIETGTILDIDDTYCTEIKIWT